MENKEVKRDLSEASQQEMLLKERKANSALGLPPFVTGSKTAVKVLTEDMKELTGGQVIINGDAKESADILEQIILEKRQGLHI